MSRPAKVENVKLLVAKAYKDGHLLFSEHALLRMHQRKIIQIEVFQIILGGYHEKRKDKLDPLNSTWNYALRGKTADGRSIRIIVAAYTPDVVVVTAVDLDENNE